MKGTSVARARRRSSPAAISALRAQATVEAEPLPGFTVEVSPYTGVEFHRTSFPESANGHALRCSMSFTVDAQVAEAMPDDRPSVDHGRATRVIAGSISVWDEADERCFGEVSYSVLDAPAADGTTVRVAHVGNIEFASTVRKSGIGRRLYERIAVAHPDIEAFPASDVLHMTGPAFRKRLAAWNPDLYRGRFDEDNVVHWDAPIRSGFLNRGGVASSTRNG